jgi:hypothetical protein
VKLPVHKSVPRRRDASTLAAILESAEIEGLIRAIDGAHVAGRCGYGARKLLPILLTKFLYVQPTWTSTLELVADNPVLTTLCGCANADELPSIHAVYRFVRKLRDFPEWIDTCTKRVHDAMRAIDPEFGAIVAGDSTDLSARANGQRYIRQGGPRRQRYSDPTASWGHRGATSTRAHGSFYGHKPHALVCVKYEVPVSWAVLTGKAPEHPQLEPLLEQAVAGGFDLKTVILDRGYDFAPVYEACHRRGMRIVCPLRKSDKLRDGHRVPVCRHGRREYRWVFAGTDMCRRATKWRCPVGKCKPRSRWIPLDRFHTAVPRTSDRSREIYARRTAVERCWARLKEEWGLLDLRVRRLDRVAQHFSLVILAYSLLRLAKLRASP